MCPAAKKPSASLAQSAMRIWTDGLEQVEDIGGGYMVVKVNSTTSHTLREHIKPYRVNRSPGTLSKIPDRKLRSLVAELDARLPQPSPSPRSRRQSAKEQAETKVFLEDFARQEAENRKRDIETGALLSAKEMAGRLGITPQALSKAVSSKRMFVLTGPSGIKYYPAFFADPRCDRADVEAVSRALGDSPGPCKLGFFTTPKFSLSGLNPVDALAKGELDKVLRAAAGYMER